MGGEVLSEQEAHEGAQGLAQGVARPVTLGKLPKERGCKLTKSEGSEDSVPACIPGDFPCPFPHPLDGAETGLPHGLLRLNLMI